MKGFSKKVSKILAIVTGFGLNFGAYNSKAMQEKSVEIVKAEEKTEDEIYDEKQKELNKRLAEATRKLRDKIYGKEQTWDEIDPAEVGRPRPWDRLDSENSMFTEGEKEFLKVYFGTLGGGALLLIGLVILGQMEKNKNVDYEQDDA